MIVFVLRDKVWAPICPSPV